MDLRAVIAVASYEIVSIAYSAVALRIAPMNTCAATLFLIGSGADGAGRNFLERETGVEPATSSLGSWHSTTELLPLSQRPKYSTARNPYVRAGVRGKQVERVG